MHKIFIEQDLLIQYFYPVFLLLIIILKKNAIIMIFLLHNFSFYNKTLYMTNANQNEWRLKCPKI